MIPCVHLQALESRKQSALVAQHDAARAQRADAHHWVRQVSSAMLVWERHTSARNRCFRARTRAAQRWRRAVAAKALRGWRTAQRMSYDRDAQRDAFVVRWHARRVGAALRAWRAATARRAAHARRTQTTARARRAGACAAAWSAWLRSCAAAHLSDSAARQRLVEAWCRSRRAAAWSHWAAAARDGSHARRSSVVGRRHARVRALRTWASRTVASREVGDLRYALAKRGALLLRL